MGLLQNASFLTAVGAVTDIYVKKYREQSEMGKEIRRIKRAIIKDFP